MKTLAGILILTLLTTPTCLAKKNAVKATNPAYGFGFTHMNTGTGHGAGYVLNGNVTSGRKSLEVGFIFNGAESLVSGGDIRYKIFLGNIYRLENENKIFKPYLQYNLIYQKGISDAPEIIDLGGKEIEVPSEPGTVATFGHYISYGNRIKVVGNTYFDSSIGLGLYSGSLDQANGPDTWGFHNGNHGVTFSFKIGFGYTFN